MRSVLNNFMFFGVVGVIICSCIVWIFFNGSQNRAVQGVALSAGFIDLGTIQPEIAQTGRVSLINNSALPLHIDRVVSDCGCTTTAMAFDLIEPYKSLEISATVDPSRITGDNFERRVQVVTHYGENSPNSGASKLYFVVKGNIDRHQVFQSLSSEITFEITPETRFPIRKSVWFVGSSSALAQLPNIIKIIDSNEQNISLNVTDRVSVFNQKRVDFELYSGLVSSDKRVRFTLNSLTPHEEPILVHIKHSSGWEIDPAIGFVPHADSVKAGCELKLSRNDGRDFDIDHLELPPGITAVTTKEGNHLVFRIFVESSFRQAKSEEVVEKKVKCFWKNGFPALSIPFVFCFPHERL